jgi:hypothetical protein
VKAWSGIVLALIALSAVWLDSWAQTEWLYYRARYDELVTSDLEAMAIRGIVMVVGVLGAMAFLSLVPRVDSWFTRMGSWTLVVYLFHGFVVKGAEYAGYMAWADDVPAFSFLVTTSLAATLALLLAWRPLASRLQHVVDPLGLVVDREGGFDRTPRQHFLQGRALLHEVHVHRVGVHPVPGVAAVVRAALVDHHQALGVADRQVAQQDLVHQAVDGGRAADADSQ